MCYNIQGAVFDFSFTFFLDILWKSFLLLFPHRFGSKAAKIYKTIKTTRGTLKIFLAKSIKKELMPRSIFGAGTLDGEKKLWKLYVTEKKDIV